VSGEPVVAVEKDGSEGTSARAGTGLGTFSSLSIRNFRFLLTGTVLSNAGQWIQQVTMSWLVYDITGSGVMLGTINLVRSLAAISMLPIAGVLIDRSSRRMIMLAVNGWIFAITLTLGILLLVGQVHVGMLFIFAFLGGLAQTVDGTLRQVMVFDLVPRSGAPNAVALIQTGWSLMRSFGPGIGGFLIIWVGAGGNFLVQAGACVLIALTIVQISFPKRNTEGVRASPLQNIKEGIRYVVGQKTTRTFMLMGFILPLFIIPIFGILPPIYAKDVFHGDAGTLGLLLSSIGVGGIAGGVVVASLGRVQRRGLIQLAALFLMSVTLIGFAFSTTLWMALTLLAVSGFFEMLFLTTNQTLLQLSIPDNLRGRVTAVVNLNAVLSPLGGLMAGAGSDLLGGPRAITMVLASVGAVIALAVFAWSPTVRDYRLAREPITQQA
jgi:MFS family permease